MLTTRTGTTSTAQEKPAGVTTAAKVEGKIYSLMRFAATPIVVAGLVGIALPGRAIDDIPTSYNNAFRSCVGRIQNTGVAAEAAASACAQALYPVELSRCVAYIEDETTIAAEDALATCTQARQQIDVARCVVEITRNNQQEPVPGVLGYCGRSLLPARYGECVIGLRRETQIPTAQALETCISASDRPTEFAPTFIPANQLPLLEPQPTPVGPAKPILPEQSPSAPTAPEVQPVPEETLPVLPGQAPPAQPVPPPATPEP